MCASLSLISLTATVVGINCSTVENCHVTDTYVKVNDCLNLYYFMGVGGVVGDNNSPSSQLLDSSFDGEVTYTGEWLNQIGGVIASNSGYVSGCVNYGTATSSQDKVGGVLGWNVNPTLEYQEAYANAGVVENCVNYGDVTASYTVGGVVGHTGHSRGTTYGIGAVRNCKNYGEVVSERDDNVGSVIGYSHSTVIENCANYAQVSNLSSPATTEKTGAVIGGVGALTTVKNCSFATDSTLNSGLSAIANRDSSATDLVEENITSFDPIDAKIEEAVAEAVAELEALIAQKADAAALAEAVQKLDAALSALGALDGYPADATLVSTVNSLKSAVGEIADLSGALEKAVEKLDETVEKLESAEKKLEDAQARIKVLEDASKAVAETPVTAGVAESSNEGSSAAVSIAAIVISAVALVGAGAVGAVTFLGKKKETETKE